MHLRQFSIEPSHPPFDPGFNQRHLDLVDFFESVDLLPLVITLSIACRAHVGRSLGGRVCLGRIRIRLGRFFQQFRFDFLIGLPSVDLNNRGNLVRAVGQIPIGIGDLQIDRLAQYGTIQSFFECPVRDCGHTIADNGHGVEHRLIGLFVRGVCIGVGHLDRVVALDLQPPVPLDRSAQAGGDTPQGDPDVASHGKAIDRFTVAAGD